MSEHLYTYQQIGIAHTPFNEKFGTPRQPGLVKEAQGQIEIFAPFNRVDAFLGLEAFSHIWLLFHFHLTPQKDFQSTVRPPRLGGNERVGVFASRSPFRPNRIGQSLVKLLEIQHRDNKITLLVEGIDLVDQTPILDIKPYLPYCESQPQASGGFASNAPQAKLSVSWSPASETQKKTLQLNEQTIALIEAVLSQDPRPGYQKGEAGQEGGLTINNFNVRYEIRATQLKIKSIENI